METIFARVHCGNDTLAERAAATAEGVRGVAKRGKKRQKEAEIIIRLVLSK
jgi:hypothetical protein